MHMRDSIAMKLKDLGVRGLEAKQYMSDIFGDSNVPGLVAKHNQNLNIETQRRSQIC